MKNRIADYLPAALRPKPNGRPSLPDVNVVSKRVERYVADHPAASLGTAFAIGVVMAWLIKRK